jgi:hypothetical protein
MLPTSRDRSHTGTPLRWLAVLGGSLLIAAAAVSCGGGNSVAFTFGTGTVHVSLTDPPSCKSPNGQFDHVYVTIRSVQAHTSASAGDGTPGWQELAPQLNSQPMQIDLLGGGSNACLLATLGSNTAVPAGVYQQIRLLLVVNDGGDGPLPLPNECAGYGFNCAKLHDGSVHELLLSSQANTGLKIPPGQIVGGPITVMAGQSVDLNIDFNTCASILMQGDGRYRLKPVLTAGQVRTGNSISGQVVDAATNLPLAGGTVLVALEQMDGAGTDLILQQAAADASGFFNFCPLPMGTVFDIVAVGIDGGDVAYNATIAAGVPGGTDIGKMPLRAETGLSTDPATLQGFVTATQGGSPATIDASVSALQTISVGGAMRAVTIPAQAVSIPDVPVESDTSCPSGVTNANCAQYTLVEPASNPSVGSFSAGSITYVAPAGGDVPYSIRALAQVPLSGGTLACSPSTLTTNQDSVGNPLKVTAGMTVEPARIDFSGC